MHGSPAGCKRRAESAARVRDAVIEHDSYRPLRESRKPPQQVFAITVAAYALDALDLATHTALMAIHPNACGALKERPAERAFELEPREDQGRPLVLKMIDRKSTRLNSSHTRPSRMPSSA